MQHLLRLALSRTNSLKNCVPLRKDELEARDDAERMRRAIITLDRKWNESVYQVFQKSIYHYENIWVNPLMRLRNV